MKYTAYIKALNGVPQDDWGFDAYLGFKRRGMDVVFFEEIEEVPKRTSSIVVSYIEDTRQFLNSLDIAIPDPLNIPHELTKYCNRWIVRTSMDGFRNGTTFPVFIKPDKVLKQFTAGVITKPSSMSFFDELPGDTRVLLSEVLDIEAEYRALVINGDIKSVNIYNGNWRYFPDWEIMESMVAHYKNAPIAYSLDVGVTNKEETILIECNDGWSLGNYGADPTIYTNLLFKRWVQLTT